MALTPLRGDPSYVEAQGAGMVTAADRMERAATTLRALMNSVEYRSDAVDAIAVNAETLASVMTKASIRYRGTGEALTDYAKVLDTAQQQADRAISQQTSTDVWGARSDMVQKEAQAAVDSLNPLQSEADREQGQVELAQARHHLAQQEAELAGAVAIYEDARRDVEQAAQIAMERIKDSIEASDLNDSFWDNFEGFKDAYLVPILNAVVEVLDVVNDLLSVVSIVLAFVPGLQGLAAALKVLSLALTLVSFAATIMLTVFGEKTMGDLVVASLLLAATVIRFKGAPKRIAGFEDEMKLKDSGRYLFTKISHQDADWKAGGKAVMEFGQGKGLEVGPKAVVPPMVDSFWSSDQPPITDQLATQDVKPVGADFSSVNVDAIIAEQFGTQSARTAPVSCSAGGGGGGGGW